MGFISNILKKKSNDTASSIELQSHVEEFVSLIRIYYQASLVSNVGITNLNMVPELAMYKRMLRIPTVGGKIGVAEKSHIRKSMMADYKLKESFFKEIDSSVRRNCKSIKDVQGYFFTFQNFTSDLMNYLTSSMQWKLQGSMIFRWMLRGTVADGINKLYTKSSWKDASTAKLARSTKSHKDTLGYSNEWVTEFICQILLLSKKDNKEKKKKRKI